MDKSVEETVFAIAKESARKKPFTDTERELLLKLVTKYSGIIGNKKTDATTTQKKAEAWARLTKEFNGSPKICQKANIKQIKKWWNNTKNKAREEAQRQEQGNQSRSQDMEYEQVLVDEESNTKFHPEVKIEIERQSSEADDTGDDEDQDFDEDESQDFIPSSRKKNSNTIDNLEEIRLKIYQQYLVQTQKKFALETIHMKKMQVMERKHRLAMNQLLIEHKKLEIEQKKLEIEHKQLEIEHFQKDDK